MATIGFIGLGNMGAPMAANLVEARPSGDRLRHRGGAGRGVGGERRPRCGERRRGGRGGRDRESPCCRPGRRCARFISVMAGFWRRARKDALLIDCSTIDVDTARAVAAAAAEAGFDMLDAPVSGGTAGAQAATPDLHGRRQRRSLCPRPADPRGDGAHDRPCRTRRQRPGGQDLQQHAARRLDDRGVRGVHARRKARTIGADIVRRQLEIDRPMLGVDQLLPGAGAGAVLAGQSRLCGGLYRGNDAEGSEAGAAGGRSQRRADAARRRGGRISISCLSTQGQGALDFSAIYRFIAKSDRKT